jgi:tetratricopeptide (TPR) repeat protein
MDDLDEAIERYKEVVLIAAEDHPDRGMFLNGPGSALMQRFRDKWSLDDLNEAIVAIEGSLDRTPENHLNRPPRLFNCGVALHYRHHRLGSKVDLNKALDKFEQALELAPLGHRMRSMILNNLSDAIINECEWIGSMKSPGQSIVIGLERDRDIPTKYRHLIPNKRHESLRSIGDVYERLQWLEKPLKYRFDLTARLHRAVSMCEEALTATDENSPEWISRQWFLADALYARFKLKYAKESLESSKMSPHLNEAITAYETAISRLPSDHPKRRILYLKIASPLLQNCKLTGTVQYVDRAISYLQDAIDLTPADYPHLADYLFLNAEAFKLRSEMVKREEDLNQAKYIYSRCATLATGVKLSRIKAAISVARMFDQQEVSQSARYFKLAVELLPSVCPRTSSSSDQLHQLRSFSGLARTAAEFALLSGKDASETLELLEIGRGIISEVQLNTRTEVKSLEDTYPALAIQFKVLREELDPPHLDYLNRVTTRARNC